MDLEVTLTSYLTYQERLVALHALDTIAQKPKISLLDEKKPPEFKELVDVINATKGGKF